MLAGIQRAKKVEDATSSKDETTPVYLLEELARMALSSPEDTMHLIDHFVKRLENRSPITKAKALKGIKYLCSRGCIDFQKGMQSKTTAIRPLQKFQGPLDQLKGDALNARVREAANDAIVAIFETTVAQPLKNSASSSQARLQGFGNDVQISPQSSKQPGSQRMVGFGSDQYRRGSVPNKQSFSSGTGPPPTPNPSSHMHKTSLLGQSTSKQSPQDPQLDNPSFSRPPKHPVMGNEAELVNDICEPGGMRLQPAQENLDRFLFMASSLNGPKLAQELSARIEGSSWQEAYRALCALQHLLNNGSSVSCGEVAVHFQADSSAVAKLAKSPHVSLRERGAVVLKLLGGDEEPNPPEPCPTPATQDSKGTPRDLLGDLLGDPADGFSSLQDPSNSLGTDLNSIVGDNSNTLENPVAVSQSVAGDMFSGLSLNGTPPNPPAQPTLGELNLQSLSSPIDPFFAAPPPNVTASANPGIDFGTTASVSNAGQNGTYGQPTMQASTHHIQAMQNPQMMMGGAAHMANAVQYPGIACAPHSQVNAQTGMNSQGFGGGSSGYRPMGGMMPQGLATGPHMTGNMYSQNAMENPLPQGGSMMGASPWMQQQPMSMNGGTDPAGFGSGPVPLMAFVGPAHTKRQNSSGRNQPAFNFIGDELKAETLRHKK